MARPKTIFINRFGFPDISATSQILGDLATSIAIGFDMHLVVSRMRYDNHNDALATIEQLGNVTIHRVWTSRFGRKHLIGRLLDYLTFYITAPLKAFQLSTKGCVLVAMTDPPMISIPLVIVARLTGAKLVNWCRTCFLKSLPR